MKHTYKIHGMTCNGCRNHVEGTLSKVKGVSKATVNLAKAEATIEMESHIPIEKFQDALKKEGGTYSIHKSGERHHQNDTAGVDAERSRSMQRCLLYCILQRWIPVFTGMINH